MKFLKIFMWFFLIFSSFFLIFFTLSSIRIIRFTVWVFWVFFIFLLMIYGASSLNAGWEISIKALTADPRFLFGLMTIALVTGFFASSKNKQKQKVS